MASNYLLMIMALVPAWQPPSPIKHLPELEAGTLNWKGIDSKQVAFSAKTDLSAKPCLNPLYLLSYPHLAFLSMFPTAAGTALEQGR